MENVDLKIAQAILDKYNKQRKPESYKFGNIIIFKRKTLFI